MSKRKYKYYHDENRQEKVSIDVELYNLIVLMNRLEWIQTTFCCYGHNDDDGSDGYISLYLDYNYLDRFCHILDSVYHCMKVEIDYNRHGDGEVPGGWLYVVVRIPGTDYWVTKETLVKSLERKFKKIRPLDKK